MEILGKNTELATFLNTYSIPVGKVIAGSLLIALGAQVKVPMYPIPFTLQPLAVFLLALHQTPKFAFCSAMLYLVECTLGFPFLASMHTNPLWIFGPTAGFLIGFPIAATLSSFLFHYFKKKTFITALFSLIPGQMAIYLLGYLFLAGYVGFDKAFGVGIAPFLVGGLIKMMMAATTVSIRKGFTTLWNRS